MFAFLFRNIGIWTIGYSSHTHRFSTVWTRGGGGHPLISKNPRSTLTTRSLKRSHEFPTKEVVARAYLAKTAPSYRRAKVSRGDLLLEHI